MPNGPRILIIDDNPDNLRVAMDLLEHHGFDVRAARSGELGLRRASQAQLILLDVDMPGLDGFETCRRLKADPQLAPIPVIFMTAHTDVDSKVTAMDVGGVDYVMKPFEPPELLARVRTHLEIAELRLALERRNRQLEDLNATLEERVARQVQEIVERTRHIELLNLQLRNQVQERSEALARALDRLSERDTTPVMRFEGRVLEDRYSIDAQLAQGGMGVVYAGHDTVTGDLIAIKVIRGDRREAHLFTRFLQEAQLAARVDHPAVVRMLHVDVHEDGFFYQVQEFVPGEPLREMLKREGALEPVRAARLVGTIASALAAAHAAGVVHRDLKPSNLMMTPDPPGVKLVDFGISKAARSADDTTTAGRALTQTGLAVGSPGYMSPEQVYGRRVGFASDVYVLGIVAHEMFTGRHPSEDGHLQPPDALRELLEQCRDFDPQARPDALAVVAAMEAFTASSITPPSWRA